MAEEKTRKNNTVGFWADRAKVIQMKEKDCTQDSPVPVNKKGKIAKRVFVAILALILLAAALGYGYFHDKYSRIYSENEDKNLSENYEDAVNVSDELLEAMRESIIMSELQQADAVEADGDIIYDEDVYNILLIGTDERTDGSYSDNARGDACMLLSVNVSGSAPVISLVSLERGMGVPILEGPYEGQWDWLTHTFRYGGAELLMKEVSHTLKVDVNHYVRINFNIFVQAIDRLGGVTVHFDEKEAEAFKKMGYEQAVVGYNHLWGDMALNYARLRYIDSDWVRVQRQREIVLSVFETCRTKSFEEIDSLVDSLLPLVKTNVPESMVAEMLTIVPSLPKAKTQQMTIPQQGTYGHMTGMGGRSMFAVDFEENSRILKEFLYPQHTAAKEKPESADAPKQ